ncbi:Conserved_hypothetical protein [Hexamita inflata]|uniref:Uncharacterized protein n=1 Tax=Hexamita inflata TaxID=28002 RepID=A0AA86PKR3_9EUKA|nr:Conserved hypothetical protein [Hexamita inflata]
MIQFAHVTMTSISSSFSECFSAKSYISGDSLKNQLSLHLLPFERLDKIANENLCKMYLPGKIVVTQIHYDDMSFPRTGDAEVNFIYQFNQEIVVAFQLSPTDYAHIIDKQNAMYELWYDVNLVKVNNSVNTISHTKYNGTNCFQKLELEYTMYGDMDVHVLPNSCAVKVDPSLQVYVEFQEGLVNSQIPIYPCVSDCDPAEFQLSQTDFSLTKLYRVKKTPATETQLASFYAHFIENRRIHISMNLKFPKNSFFVVVSRNFDNIFAKDTWGCKTNDVHLDAFTILNPNLVSIQFRDSLTNKLKCNTLDAVQVKIDVYVYDQKYSARYEKQYSIEEFNQNIGIQFNNTVESIKLRENYNVDLSKTVVVVSYLNSTGDILWEIISYHFAYIGCVSRATLHLYNDQTCLNFSFDSHGQCVIQNIPSTGKNTLGIYYVEDNISHSLGFYRFNYEIDYKILHHSVCFVCDQYIPDVTYAKQSCVENQQFTKEKIKSSIIGFGIVTKFEFIILESVVTEYQNFFVYFAVVSVSLLIFVGVFTLVLIYKLS